MADAVVDRADEDNPFRFGASVLDVMRVEGRLDFNVHVCLSHAGVTWTQYRSVIGSYGEASSGRWALRGALRNW